jgi:hypothetical protein
MNSAITQLGALCLFQLIGGAAIGSFVRALLRRSFSSTSFFFLIWGAFFGGIPIFFGVGQMQSGSPWFLVVQLAVFFGAIVLIAFISDELLSALRSGNTITIAIGGVFLVFGVIMLSGNISSMKSFPERLLGGGIFFLSGGAVFCLGLWRIIKGNP